jgi:2,4-dienoyl-CoA reductase-like NADH-dependent reductase (Old Yellow Enzyme family)
MADQHRRLHDPIEIGSAKLRNRLALAAVTRGVADEDGRPTAEMAAYYRRFARNRVGLIITEATYVPGLASRTYLSQPGMTGPSHAEGWKRVVEAVKAEGGHIFLQLQHGGPFREPELGPGMGATDRVPAVPSWQRQRPYTQTRRIERAEIPTLVEGFAQAAALARAVGFDGVEIHGSRGYLLDDFLSGYNNREDDYGGSLENRLRFPGEVVRAVRDAVGPLPLSYNLSLYKMDTVDYLPPGGTAEIARVLEVLASAGVDAFHVSTRGLDRCCIGETRFLDVVRGATDRKVIGGGGLRTLDDAETALQQGRLDVVSLARGLVANPDILERAEKGLALAPYRRGLERIAVEDLPQ